MTSQPLTDTGLTHVITSADLGDYFEVRITAKSATQFGIATVRSPGVAVPRPPVRTDAGLTAANRGGVTSTSAKGVATISDPAGAKGDGVFVYGYSQPRELGWFALDANKRFTVNFLGLTPGDHKLAVMNQSGKLVGWVSVTRPQEAVSLSGTANPLIAAGAGALIVVIVIVIVVTQRRGGSRRSDGTERGERVGAPCGLEPRDPRNCDDTVSGQHGSRPLHQVHGIQRAEVPVVDRDGPSSTTITADLVSAGFEF